MSMTPRHLLAGLLGLCALVSCTDDQYYDTHPYGQYGNRRPTQPYGQAGTPAPYGTPNPYGTPAPNPYGSPYAPGAQDNNPYGPAPEPTPNPVPPTPGPTEYPVAQRTNNPDQVVSPFDPNRVIDISGYKSGQKVRDPENKKIFIVP